ncbi:hypothetical protein VP01_4037g1 [Puccinia sorghi]|uniref:Tc1-like transposase DDE domain-containing protein n=1 Tax=Puccinia sorghi TaxID=27349 RepID=A0A0L6URQ0_9BASI|nr:hypothetical protein VP01_4037g1 [Puccinia sorghi]
MAMEPIVLDCLFPTNIKSMKNPIKLMKRPMNYKNKLMNIHKQFKKYTGNYSRGNQPQRLSRISPRIKARINKHRINPVCRILDDACTQQPSASTNQKGPKSQLTTNVLTSVLLLLEDNLTTTLKKMSEHILNVGQKIIFIDESGFNSQNHPSHGYLLTGMPCSRFENKCKRQPYQPYRTTANNICNFLLHLQDHCPPGSIIIMDNPPINGGNDFERVQLLIKESAKTLDTEFLSNYSPFLNPIELTFNILKTHEITEKMTPGIFQKSFLHCQKFYPACTYMQPISGNIIKDTENFFQLPQLYISC